MRNFQFRRFRHCQNILVALAATLMCARAGADDVPGKLMGAETNSDFAYQRLAKLCDTFGPRFSGTTNLEAAIDWALGQMKNDGLENVHGEKVMVPHWVRGAESAELLEPRLRRLPILGLGGSIATPPEGITAEVLVVKNFADLAGRKGRSDGQNRSVQSSLHLLRRDRRHSFARRN